MYSTLISTFSGYKLERFMLLLSPQGGGLLMQTGAYAKFKNLLGYIRLRCTHTYPNKFRS